MRPHAARPRGVIQPLMSDDDFVRSLRSDSPSLQNIRQMIQRYNWLKGKGVPNYNLQDYLDRLRRRVFEWLPANIEDVNRGAMLDLMDDIQKEQNSLIRRATHIFAHGGQAADDVNELFSTIAEGTGSIIIDETDIWQQALTGVTSTCAGFRQEVLSAFAMILQAETGRRLVRKLLNQRLRIRIVPQTSKAREAQTRLMRVVAEERKRSGTGVIVGRGGGSSSDLGHEVSSPGLATADPASFLNNRMFDVSGYLGAWASKQANIDLQTGAPLPPVGGGAPMGAEAIVAIEPGMKDSAVFGVDADGAPLVTPFFLTLAHELNHAKRIVRGRTRGGTLPSRHEHFHTAEEYHNIVTSKTSENRLREEFGLGVRHGHTGGMRD